MPLETLFVYTVAAFVVVMIPGPLSLFMVENSARYGIFKSWPAFLGGTLASSMYLVVSAAGVGVLIVGSPNFYLAFKICGAVYLVGLGVATVRAATTRSQSAASQNTHTVSPRFWHLFSKAFLLGASNPKDIIFFMAFLPQFISPHGNLVHQTVIIVSVWIAVDMICKLGYGLLAQSIRPFISTPNRMSAFGKTTGGLYITAGVVAAAFA